MIKICDKKVSVNYTVKIVNTYIMCICVYVCVFVCFGYVGVQFKMSLKVFLSSYKKKSKIK